MSATLIDPPRRSPAARPPAPRPAPLRPPRPRRRPSLWVFPAALAASALIHLFFLLTMRFELVPTSGPPATSADAVVPRPQGMRVYDIVAVDAAENLTIEEEETGRPVPPRLVAPSMPQTPAIPTTTLPREQPAEPGARTSIAERVAPLMGNRQLWTTPPVEVAVPEPADVVRARVADRLGAWNDSVRLASEAAAKAVDWTVRDKDGGRWGVSPAGIHLGSFTLPLNNQFVPPAGRRDEINGLIRNWNEIQAQRNQAEIRAQIEERAKAIRERKEAERKDTTKVVAGGRGG